MTDDKDGTEKLRCPAHPGLDVLDARFTMAGAVSAHGHRVDGRWFACAALIHPERLDALADQAAAQRFGCETCGGDLEHPTLGWGGYVYCSTECKNIAKENTQ